MWTLILLVLVLVAHSSHAFARVREYRPEGELHIKPKENLVSAGANVSFTCLHPHNVTFLWTFTSKIQLYEIVNGTGHINGSDMFFSRILIYGTSRYMSGEIVCSTEEENSKAVGFLIVNGVQMGGACHNSSDCLTDRASCINEICECPRNHVRLRLTENGFDVCREMIYSLYDPCEFNEQCSHLVDPNSICSTVCICAPYAKDRKGVCISLNELSYNRSQEMYRVGLIAVTCIIILIVAMSLWVTLKRSCQEQSNSGLNGTTQTDLIYPDGIMVDGLPDKPPSYEDVIVSPDGFAAPPNIKEALKHCMTAKRLLRQVSAPAGQLLPQIQGMNLKLNSENKKISEA